MRTAPKTGPVADWLEVERADRSNLRYQPVCPGDAWDCLLFHRTLSHAEVDLPGFLDSPPAECPIDDLARFAGRYKILGFLAAVNTLDVHVKAGTLYTSGEDDTSGEVFPPYKAPVHWCRDGRFRWSVWPSILEFQEVEDRVTVSVTTPGGATYRGERIEAADA